MRINAKLVRVTDVSHENDIDAIRIGQPSGYPADSPRTRVSSSGSGGGGGGGESDDSPRTLLIQSIGRSGEEDSVRTKVYSAASAFEASCRSHIRPSKVRRSILAAYRELNRRDGTWRPRLCMADTSGRASRIVRAPLSARNESQRERQYARAATPGGDRRTDP